MRLRTVVPYSLHKTILQPAVAILLLLTAGCISDYKFESLSEYTIDHNALEDGDSILVIYCSGGPDDNRDREYYYHLVVTTVDGRDTVNLLTHDIKNINEEQPVKAFISSQSPAFKLFQANLEDVRDTNIDSIVVKPISRVVRNLDYKHIEDNHYPTVIGMMGELFTDLPPDVREIAEKNIREAKANKADSSGDSM
ncbi:MAG: hypothetical protein EOP49_20580 [Sphingobacteriales bacterium]|nr:MAG: hypothetical protein EOP49_20580 [Sphingobacteriales bacterium]